MIFNIFRPVYKSNVYSNIMKLRGLQLYLLCRRIFNFTGFLSCFYFIFLFNWTNVWYFSIYS